MTGAPPASSSTSPMPVPESVNSAAASSIDALLIGLPSRLVNVMSR